MPRLYPVKYSRLKEEHKEQEGTSDASSEADIVDPTNNQRPRHDAAITADVRW